jgi:RimJ/RimL family protein N-acetyltransferase
MSMPFESLRAVEFDERFLDASWGWLQDPGLRWLIRSGEQTREEQRRWFEGLRGRADYLIWGVEHEGSPIAVFGVKNIAGDGTGEFFVYIGTEDFRARGIGNWVQAEVEARAREHGLKELWATIRQENERALRFARNQGYELAAPDSEGMVRIRKPVPPA